MARKIIVCTLCLIFTTSLAFAQKKWLPDDVQTTTLLVERFKYQDPNNTLEDVDEFFEDDRDDFIEETNDNLEAYNEKLEPIFKKYKHSFELVPVGKIDELYPDKNEHRYILRREAFFGNKRSLNLKTKEVEDESYFAYRYYFYDRKTKESYPYYYFSGDQWQQLKRIVYWLNKTDNQTVSDQ